MTDKKKKALKIVQIIIAAILILFFGLLVVLGIFVRTDTEKVKNLPFTVFEITSDSMYPKIKKGDGIIEVHTDYNKLKVGDIITIFNGGEFVTHRIVEINGNMVTTKGDANPYSDAPITQNRYVGKVSVVLPGFSAFLYMTEGWKKAIWIVVILFVLFGPEFIVKVSEAKRKTAKEKRKAAEEEARKPQVEIINENPQIETLDFKYRTARRSVRRYHKTSGSKENMQDPVPQRKTQNNNLKSVKPKAGNRRKTASRRKERQKIEREN